MTSDVIQAVSKRAGRYRGEGVRHGGVAFTAELELAPVFDVRGVELSFVARETGGAVFHREKALVATDPSGRPAMWTFHTNADGVWQQPLRSERSTADGARVLVFGVGDLSDASTLRTEIEVELAADGGLGHRRSVGVPGSELIERSRTRARRVPSFDVWHVAIPVSELERSVAFYCGRLGFALLGRDEYEDKRQAFIAVREGGFVIELFQPKGKWADAPPKRPDHVAFECADLAAFRAAAGEAREIAVFDNGVKFLPLVDPDGVDLEFFEGRAVYERDTLRPSAT